MTVEGDEVPDDASIGRTLHALANSSPEEAFLRAIECLAQLDEGARIAGLECLATLERDPGTDAMTSALQDPDALVRVAALELVVAGARPPPSIVEQLASSDPAEVVRAYAAWALGRIGNGHALATLRSRLLLEQSAAVRSSLAEALYRLTNHPPYLDLLIEHLSSSDPEARAFTANSAIGVISRENAQRIIDALRAVLAKETLPAVAAALSDSLETAEAMQRDDDYELE